MPMSLNFDVDDRIRWCMSSRVPVTACKAIDRERWRRSCGANSGHDPLRLGSSLVGVLSSVRMTRRLGRPCQSDAEDTRVRIIREARLAFTTRGYDNTTNREISAGAGITAAAIYHYFPSKIDLFVAVFEDVQSKVYDAFDAAVAKQETFLEKFDTLFDTMMDLGDDDPMLASFVVGVVTEAEHHPDLRNALRQVIPRNQSFLTNLCLEAKERGELPEALPVQTAVDVISGVLGGFARLSVTVRDRKRLRSVAKVYKNMARSALSRTSL